MKEKLKRRVLTRIPLRLFDPWMKGGDCIVMSGDPLVIYTLDWVLRDVPLAIWPVLRELRKIPVYILTGSSWAYDNPEIVNWMKSWQQKLSNRFPNIRIINLANTETDHRMMANAGVRSAFFSHNALISPFVFRILPDAEKRFDAVYDARISSFKRHHLAAKINNLALIAYKHNVSHDDSYIMSVKEKLAQAHWFNDPLSADYRIMSPSEVNTAISRCRVGICLSGVEGAMFASIQYLLAGLPVVSTRSRGGRDEFFESDYVRIVDDNENAVAEGVWEMCRCSVPPEEIRRRTLEKIDIHRDRLFGILDTICDETKWREKMRSRWDSWRVLPFPQPVTPDIIRGRIKEAAKF